MNIIIGVLEGSSEFSTPTAKGLAEKDKKISISIWKLRSAFGEKISSHLIKVSIPFIQNLERIESPSKDKLTS